jgi:ribosomal protein S18 acetylase RimI-like enzyme
MRQIILLSIIMCCSIFNSLAANYEETMKQNIEKMNQLQKATDLVDLANQFERIGQKEADKWLPGYYAAYAYISISFFNQDLTNEQKLSYLDQAQKQIDHILTIAEKESEIFALQGLLYQMRISDPSEGFKYSMLSNEALAKAKTMNAENPRAYYLLGMNLFYTPAEYGGGPAVAKSMFEKAASLFEKSKNNNSLLPSWGEKNNAHLLGQCSGK